METALRETEEESGLKLDQLKVVPGNIPIQFVKLTCLSFTLASNLF